MHNLSFCCGLAAKIIAVELKSTSNELFVAGLIHDIGKLVMYIAFPVSKLGTDTILLDNLSNHY
jgi:HD-like signal output (HDOD) protein